MRRIGQWSNPGTCIMQFMSQFLAAPRAPHPGAPLFGAPHLPILQAVRSSLLQYPSWKPWPVTGLCFHAKDSQLLGRFTAASSVSVPPHPSPRQRRRRRRRLRRRRRSRLRCHCRCRRHGSAQRGPQARDRKPYSPVLRSTRSPWLPPTRPPHHHSDAAGSTVAAAAAAAAAAAVTDWCSAVPRPGAENRAPIAALPVPGPDTPHVPPVAPPPPPPRIGAALPVPGPDAPPAPIAATPPSPPPSLP
jgi:hypothetical protein